jgi:TIR domain
MLQSGAEKIPIFKHEKLGERRSAGWAAQRNHGIMGTMETRRKQVFLSYARNDLKHAERLYEDLSKDPGVHIWFDKRDLLPGIKWRPAIRKAIRESSSFVALFSKQGTSTRGFRNTELSQALEIVKEFPDDQIFLIPTKLEECEVPNDEVGEFNFAMLFPDWDHGVENICLAAGIRSPKNKKGPKRASDRRKSKIALSPERAYQVKIVLLSKAVPKLQGVLKDLNSVQTFFHFSSLDLMPSRGALTQRGGEPQLYIDRLSKPFYACVAPLETDHTICVTDRFLAFDENGHHHYNYLAYIGDRDERIAFNSIRGLEEHAAQANVPIERAISFGLVSDVTAYFLQLDYHPASRGCPMDFTEDHADMVKGLRLRRFCNACMTRLEKNPALRDAVQAMLDWAPAFH